ncbi:sensor histidine kinase [Pseudonocardia sp. TRM90224]|uniref:sensor histidine kinase n=1 Tax=Pseudonocardia sp. TRM90224 TaxID=2812678 RepID=UPI001E3E6424|nr:nitrate- and nitrite sensing domain-containing protein [Pseudonocardia sp. TRM90224]
MTSIQSGPSWADRLDPRNWTLVWKLVAIGLVPALLALILGALRVADQAGSASQLGSDTRLLALRDEVASAAHALRQERDEAVLYIAGNRSGDAGVLNVAEGQVNDAVTKMRDAIGTGEDLDDGSTAVRQGTEGVLGQLELLRAAVDITAQDKRGDILNRYSNIISRLDALDRAMLRQLRTPASANLSDGLTAATNAAEQLAVEHTIIGAAIRVATVAPRGTIPISAEDLTALEAARAQLTSDYREFQVALVAVSNVGNVLDDLTANDVRDALREEVKGKGQRGEPILATSAAWDAAYNDSRAVIDRNIEDVRSELNVTTDAAADRASNLAGVNSVILMLGLLAGITVMVLVARALLRSLRVLRTAALDVAERRLPLAVESMRAGETPDVTVDPVPLTSRDEVGQVARAFDAVHGQAIRLAAEQALLQSNVSAMFVNLSRRSQALVERQLTLIEQLESNEQDADQLSNLFQLDHLATRMRRNSENLLVLAGTDLAKRNVAPVPMVDVLRAAVSEVEQYQRIVVQTPPNATLVGRAASDIVHLLAELLDNATNFSPPDSQVVMSTTRTPDGSIVVEIADRGVGMVDHELADANMRLSGPATVDVSASRRMGLFVVGRLGARHGINVRLSASSSAPGSGLTASVTVPASLVPSSEPSEIGRPAGTPRPTPVPLQGAMAQGMPQQQQRNSLNGAGQTGSLSAFVAGTDGPANPGSVFDVPTGGDSSLFGGPANGTNGAPPAPTTPPTTPPATPPLPSRRPGSSLRPDGPPRKPDETGPPDDEQRKAREVAEQARRDQEAAARAEQERAARAAEQAKKEAEQAEAARNAAAASTFTAPPTGETPGGDSMFGTGAAPLPSPRPTPVPPAPPTMPIPVIGRTGSAPLPQRAKPEPEQQAQPSPRPTPQPVHQQNQQPPVNQQQPQVQMPPIQMPQYLPPPTPSQPAVQAQASAPPAEPQAPEQQAPQHQAPQHQAPQHQQLFQQPNPPQGQQGQQQFPGQQYPGQPQSYQQLPPQQYPPQQQYPAAPQHQQPTQQQPVPPQNQPNPQPVARANPAPAPVNRPVQASTPDELFAPSVPVIAEPTPVVRNGATGFDLGETTPIFEEIASAWFRSNRPIPVNWETENGEGEPSAEQAAAAASAPAAPPAAPAPEARVAPSPTPAPRPAPVARPTPAPMPDAAPVTEQVPIQQPVQQPAQQPVQQPTQQPAPEPMPEPTFASAADEGWRAAAAEIANDTPDELTSAGLPKRRPRARLVPGSAGSTVLTPPAAASRSAEMIRGRLASYQQGVRQGRESRTRGTAGAEGTDPATAGGNHDEERT